MKNIKELSDKEILGLTEEQLDKMVKVRMAEEGIKILTMPVTPTYKEVPAKTEIAYSVTGVSDKFLKKSDAQKVSDLLLSIKDNLVKTSYIGSDYNNSYITKLDPYNLDQLGIIKEDKFYAKEQVTEFNELLEENKKIKADYAYDLDEYNNEYEAGKEVREEVYGTYQRVSKKYYDMDVLKRRYEEYLTLADGNAKTAMKFLKNAYSIDLETEQYVVSGKVNDTVVLEAKGSLSLED